MDNTNKEKLKEAGAFWIKTSKTGNNFLTGSVKTESGEEVKVIVFKNKYKTEGSNQPDYRAYFDTKPAGPQAQQESKAKKETKSSESKSEVKSEEIPF